MTLLTEIPVWIPGSMPNSNNNLSFWIPFETVFYKATAHMVMLTMEDFRKAVLKIACPGIVTYFHLKWCLEKEWGIRTLQGEDLKPLI